MEAVEIKKILIFWSIFFLFSSCNNKKIEVKQEERKMIENEIIAKKPILNEADFSKLVNSYPVSNILVDTLSSFDSFIRQGDYFSELTKPKVIVSYKLYDKKHKIHYGLFFEIWVLAFENETLSNNFANTISNYCAKGRAESAIMSKRFTNYGVYRDHILFYKHTLHSSDKLVLFSDLINLANSRVCL